ncbi:MAG: DNA-3-methyladenine glycosylase 2 family protein [Bacteroidota bacterium]
MIKMEYLLHLKKDKKLAIILEEQFHELKYHENIPLRLIASIMSQQLNTKVAAIIYNRFLQLYDGIEPSATQILATSYAQLRSIGLSHAKASYVHNVAHFCVEHKISDKQLLAMENEEVIDLLVQIKGVGRWTVEMLLMFTLGRQDVFPIDDLGIKQAMIKLYKIKEEDKKLLKERLLKISAKWSPYRTYACLHLWGWKDGAG